MIRHSSSFFISLIIHITIAISLFFIWKNIPSFKKEPEKKVPVKLCCIIEKEAEPKVVVQPKPKPIPPKPKPIPKKPKKKPKPKVEKKIIPKKIVPVIKEEIKPQEPIAIEEEPKKVKIIEEKTEVIPEVQKESPHAKELRLEKDYLDEHIQEISRLLQENLYYPRSARKRGIVGEIIVKFNLSTNGSAHSIKVISSNSDILSRAAVKTIENLSDNFPKPSEELHLHVPINYKLRR